LPVCEELKVHFIQAFTFVFHRQAWAFVGVIGGGNSSCNESVRNYENHSTGGKALAQKEFFTMDGQKFVVRAYSEWNDGRKAFCQILHLGKKLEILYMLFSLELLVAF